LRQRLPVLLRSRAVTIGGAIDGVVVQQEEVIVRRELGVEFDHTIAVAQTGIEAGERIFRRERPTTAMGDQPGVRPVRS
jgi:hypothetical protein